MTYFYATTRCARNCEKSYMKRLVSILCLTPLSQELFDSDYLIVSRMRNMSVASKKLL